MRVAVVLALLLAVTGCELNPYCLNCLGPGDGGDSDDGGDDGGGPDGSIDGGTDGGTDGGSCIPIDEACNGLDEDCDDLIDEDFDLDTDPLNCGQCGESCLVPNAEVECVAGECGIVDCLPGFANLDDGEPGCEYQCPVFPTTTEQCNGLDDDCDGEEDEVAELPPPPDPSSVCRVTSGTPCQGVTLVCDKRNGLGTWFCDYSDEVEFDPAVPNGVVAEETKCDGFDGDCDGVADDFFGDLGDDCDDGNLGLCRDEGLVVCDPTDDSQTICDFDLGANPTPGAPFAEVCNNIDDNCDGVIDNSDPLDPARIIDDMVNIDPPGPLDFWIYRYEASRVDASDTDAGVLTTRACSQEDVLPWTTVGYDAAAEACDDAGFRLCSAEEWLAACEGVAANLYPYGTSYEAATCNGADFDPIPGLPVDHILQPTGEMAMCVSADGIEDMSGNVKEWTNDPQGMSGGFTIYTTRGGSYESPALGLTCATVLSQARADTALPTLGFRCCSDTAP